jgi:hypothetical protein
VHQQRAALSRRRAAGLDGGADAGGHLGAGIERAAHALEIAVDGVVGDAD